MIKDINSILLSTGKYLLEIKKMKKLSGEWDGSQFKSDADKLANKLLTKLLNDFTPKIKVVSEEDDKSHKKIRPKMYWLIDPIDGTRSFVEGFDGFVTQLALIKNGKPMLSGIYAPERNEIYLSEKNKGVSLNGKFLRRIDSKNKITIIDNYPKPKGITKFIFNRLNCDKYLECGSLGLKLCKIVDGSANLFVKDVIVHDWDIAPAHLMLEEMGFFINDYEGNQINYNKQNLINGFIASNNLFLQKKVNNIVKTKL